ALSMSPLPKQINYHDPYVTFVMLGCDDVTKQMLEKIPADSREAAQRDALYARGQFLCNKGDKEKAKEVFLQYLALPPQYSTYNDDKGDTIKRRIVPDFLGILLNQCGLEEEAQKVADEIYALEKNIPGNNSAGKLGFQAYQANKNGNSDKANKLFLEAIGEVEKINSDLGDNQSQELKSVLAYFQAMYTPDPLIEKIEGAIMRK
ncbi:MAG: hypothetical protein ACRC2T_19815, partial [Thermoguttaceae bacterium]